MAGQVVTHLTRRAPDLVEAERSDDRFCEIAIEVKVWMQAPPAVEVARPRRCPACGAAGHPLGGGPGLIGHGFRERHVRGPLADGEAPHAATILLRRFRCRRCGAIVSVGPRGLLRRRLYAAASITLALALWSARKQAPSRVREQISPWRAVGAAARGWQTLVRWAKAAVTGALWPTLRARVGRVIALVAGHGPPDDPLEARVMAGAVHVR